MSNEKKNATLGMSRLVKLGAGLVKTLKRFLISLLGRTG
jgi:hypothetical protein